MGRSCTRVRLFCFCGGSVPHANSVLDRRLRLPDSRSEQTTGIESVLTVSIPSHRCTTFGIAAPHPVDGSTAAPSIATGTAGAPKAAGFGVLHQSAALRHRRLRIVRRNLLLFGVPSLPFPSLPPSIASTGFYHFRACDRSDTLCAQSAGSDRVWLRFLSFPLYVFVTIRRIEKAQTFDDPDQLASYGSLYDKYAVHTDETHRHSSAAVAVAAHCKQRLAMASCFVRSRCSSRTCNRRQWSSSLAHPLRGRPNQPWGSIVHESAADAAPSPPLHLSYPCQP